MVIEFWCRHKLKYKGAREYYATPLKEIPIRRIDFTNPSDVSMHEEIVKRVDEIMNMLAQLYDSSRFFKGLKLSRLNKDDVLPELDSEAIISSLPPEIIFSIRTHPGIKTVHENDFDEAKFILSKVGYVITTLEGQQLNLGSKDGKSIFLFGDDAILRIARDVLEKHVGETWFHIKEEPIIPFNSNDFIAEKERVVNKVSQLRDDIHHLQDSIDNSVIKLYGLNEALLRG